VDQTEVTATGTSPLISARVDDTSVYDAKGHKLGTVYTFHIDRYHGQVEYAVLSIGGLLGLGQSYHPVPFALLQVNQQKGGYTIGIDKAVLNGGPSYRPDTAPVWDADYARRITSYFASAMPTR
jgi:hypothetical protein